MNCFMSRLLFFIIVKLITFDITDTVSENNGNNFFANPNKTIPEHNVINASNIILTMSTKFSKHRASEAKYSIHTEINPAIGQSHFVSPHYEQYLQQTSVLYGLTKVLNSSALNSLCIDQLKIINRGILRRDHWAMKMLDASGTKPPGFIFGQNYWLGSREGCGAVQNPVKITLSKNYQRVMHYSLLTDRAPFDVDYRVVYLRHQSPWQVEIKLMSEHIIHVGLCLPKICTLHEIHELTTEYLKNRLLMENDIYDIRPEVIYVKDLELKKSFFEKRTFKILSSCIVLTSLMITTGALLNIKSSGNDSKTIESSTVDNNLINCQLTQSAQFQNTLWNKFKNFLKCFDIIVNSEKMFATYNNENNQIPIINGLRSVSAFWILVFHVMWFMYFTVNNKVFLLTYAEQVFFQYVSSAPILVDVFFTVSGFLQSYNFLRNTKQIETIRRNALRQNATLFFKILFHRYLRLAPLYLVIMGMVDLFYAYVGDVSVYHISEHRDEICSQYWWRNILFIQNLFDHNDMCLNWTWSLACEMQYFIISSLLLFVFVKNPKFVKILTVSGFSINILWTFYIGLSSKFQFSFDSCFATGTDIYINPFVRIMPYIMGAAAGLYILEKNDQFDISELKEKCFWNLAILTFFICFYSTIKRDLSYKMAITLFVFGRFCFSLSICWMIIGSATGRGSWWSRILEAKVFQHINRLSYAIYLLNPFIIALFFSLTSASTHADPFMLSVICFGFFVIVYLTSIVFSLAFEMPYCNWSHMMLKSARKTKTK